MKRPLVLLSTLMLCAVLTGCSSDPREDAVNGVISNMNASAGAVDSITKEIQKAIDKHNKDNAPLDFTEAIKITQNLEKEGKNAQKLKVERVDLYKPANPEEKADFDQRFKPRIASAFAELVKAKTNLNNVLQKAEAIDKEKVDELRSKIREAEGPYETIARQQG